MKKILISTFEKTLIDEEEAIDVNTIIEIDKFRKQGNIFAIISENILNYSLEYNKDFPFLDYIIALDGAIIYDVSKNKLIHKKSIKSNSVKKALNLTDNIKLYGLNCIYTKDNFLNNYEELKNSIYKIRIVFDNLEQKDLLINKLKTIDVNFYSTNEENYIDIVSSNTNRIIAIKKLVNDKRYVKKYIVLGTEKDNEIISKSEKYDIYCVNDASKILRNKIENILKENNTYGVLELLKKINK